MKHLMIFTAVIIICGTMVMTSCSDDDPVVVTDDKPWTISADYMDPNVRPGDDFFMHCNGGYWQSTPVRELKEVLAETRASTRNTPSTL